MSKITSYTNNRFPQKSFDHSMNIEDLIRQNEQLKQSIEELIQQNTQLTDIIQQLSNQHQTNNQNIPHINQQEIQALAHQVIALQQELELQRKKKQHDQLHSQGDAEQTIKIIEELSTQFQAMQEHYQIEMQKLQQELMSQKGQCKVILESTEGRFNKTLEEYYNLLEKLKKKDEIIAQLQLKLSQKPHASKKELKISATIQDLRMTLEKQIEEKQKVIKMYEELIITLKTKLIEK